MDILCEKSTHIPRGKGGFFENTRGSWPHPGGYPRVGQSLLERVTGGLEVEFIREIKIRKQNKTQRYTTQQNKTYKTKR